MVSIIMPAYNAEDYIGESIESVLNQTYTDWELIIINDGSTDSTLSVAKQYSKLDSRIKVIDKVNGKQASARNAGLKNSTGDWIAFLDADDLWTANKLEKQINFAKNYSDIDVIYSGGWIFNLNDLENLTPYITQFGFFDSEEMYKLEFSGNFVPVLSVIAKRSLLLKTGFQDEQVNIAGCEDWDYWLRIAKAGGRFYGMEDNLFYYRRHTTNVSSDLVKMAFASLNVLLKNYDPILISENELSHLCKKIIKPTTKAAMMQNKTDELIKLLSKINSVIKSIYFKNIYKILNVIPKLYWPVRLINLLDRFA